MWLLSVAEHFMAFHNFNNVRYICTIHHKTQNVFFQIKLQILAYVHDIVMIVIHDINTKRVNH